MINLNNTKDIKLGTLSKEQSKVVARLYTLTDWSTKSLYINDLEELAKACNIEVNSMAQIYKYLLDHETLIQTDSGLTWASVPDRYKNK